VTVEARLRLYRQRQTCRALTNAWVTLATAGGRLDADQFRWAARYALDGLAIGEALAAAAATDPEADRAAALASAAEDQRRCSGPSVLTYPEGFRDEVAGRRRAFMEDEA
jgi:hypothetical protein